jgi:hypothetical protein
MGCCCCCFKSDDKEHDVFDSPLLQKRDIDEIAQLKSRRCPVCDNDTPLYFLKMLSHDESLSAIFTASIVRYNAKFFSGKYFNEIRGKVYSFSRARARCFRLLLCVF